MIEIATGCAIAALMFSFITLILSILSISYVIGMRNSTHQIQYVPVNEGISDESVKKGFEDAFSSSFDDDDSIHV